VYGFAQGPIQLEDVKIKTTGKISQGCRVEENFNNPFIHDGKFTLVINKNLADFQVAQELAEQIDGQLRSTYKESVLRPNKGLEGAMAIKPVQGEIGTLEEGRLARAINAFNVEVTIPAESYNDPVEFLSRVMGLPILEPSTPAQVVVNERAGTIVMSADVEIGAVLIHNKGLVIEVGQPDTGNRWVTLETATKPTPKLQSLVAALNGLKVPPEDIISIIKTIDRDGKLHGRLIVE
jgi:flagellar P-ring protein precursor FlgI